MTGRWLSGLVMYGALVLIGGRLVATHGRTLSAPAPVAQGTLAADRPTHPGLLFDAADRPRLSRRAKQPALAPIADRVLTRARRLLDAPPIVPSITKRGEPDPPGETKGIASARRLQGRVIDLAMAFTLTGDRRYRDAAVALLFDALDRWRIWVDTAHQPPYDLMTGENALTFGLAYDWLYHDLTADERTRLREGLERRVLQPYLDATTGAKPMSWFTAAHNWNTVCNGGATVLALALAGESDLAPRVLALSVPAMRRYWDHLKDDGGWDEGTGYWRYGHRYGLIAAEALRRRGHPDGDAVFARPGVRQTGNFPIAFAPGRTLAAGFGDSNSRVSDAIFYLLARTYHNADYVWFEDRARAAADDGDPAAGGWPLDSLTLLWRPVGEPWLPEATPDFKPSFAPIASFPAIGWAMLAERQPDPRFFLAFKNGSLAANHTHLDLNTINVGVGETMVLRELGSRPYPADYFGPKRYDYYELTTAGHNTVLIDGQGQTRGTQGQLEQIPLEQAPGRPERAAFVGIADSAYGAGVRRARRHVVFVDRRFWVLLDEIDATAPVPVDLRFHTYGIVGTSIPRGASVPHSASVPHGANGGPDDAPGRRLVTENGVGVEIISPEPATLRSAVEDAEGWIRPVRVLRLTSAAPALSHTIVTILVPRIDGGPSGLPAAVDRTADTLIVRLGGDRVTFRRAVDGWRVAP